MKKIWAIASYNRADRQNLLMRLNEWGYGPDEIIISTQTRKDYEEYKRNWGKYATIIYREGSCVSDNRNHLFDYLEEQGYDGNIIMSSDKVRGYYTLSPDGARLQEVETREEMERLLDTMIATRDKLGGEVVGGYTPANAFYMSNSIHINQQMIACFMVFKPHTPWRFEPYCRVKEDFELIMRIVSQGKRVVRFNNVALKATLHTVGGSHELWNSGGDKVNWECSQYILNKYPNLARPHPTRPNEIKYVGPTKKINIKLK